MKIGFIGLGTMGRHMASNLMKGGYELVVNDVRREAAAPHLKAGATWADTPRAVASARRAWARGSPPARSTSISRRTRPRSCGRSTRSTRSAAFTCSTRR